MFVVVLPLAVCLRAGRRERWGGGGRLIVCASFDVWFLTERRRGREEEGREGGETEGGGGRRTRWEKNGDVRMTDWEGGDR